MEIKSFIDARFLVPPMVAAIFIFLTNPVDYFASIQEISLPIFLGGTVFIFGVGFLISSAVTTLIILFKCKQTLSKKSIEKLPKLFPYLKCGDCFTIAELEVATWLTIESKKLKYIREQIHKRWNAFNANANSAFALLLVLISIFFLNIIKSPVNPHLWWTLFILVEFVFIANACDAYNSLKEIDNIMIRRREME